eukprot:4866482-Prymnesium_polylepis.1
MRDRTPCAHVGFLGKARSYREGAAPPQPQASATWPPSRTLAAAAAGSASARAPTAPDEATTLERGRHRQWGRHPRRRRRLRPALRLAGRATRARRPCRQRAAGAAARGSPAPLHRPPPPPRRRHPRDRRRHRRRRQGAGASARGRLAEGAAAARRVRGKSPT